MNKKNSKIRFNWKSYEKDFKSFLTYFYSNIIQTDLKNYVYIDVIRNKIKK